MKRAYEEIRRELNEVQEFIEGAYKKRRLLNKERASYPEEKARVVEIVAKELAEDREKERATLLSHLPARLRTMLMDEGGRAAFPALGSLISMGLEVDVFDVSRLTRADVINHRSMVSFSRTRRKQSLMWIGGNYYPQQPMTIMIPILTMIQMFPLISGKLRSSVTSATPREYYLLSLQWDPWILKEMVILSRTMIVHQKP